MNTKNTKRALLASVVSMLLCVSMLIGSTFAWFTDNASTNVNTIESGTLKVELLKLENGEWVNAEGNTLGFVDDEDNVLKNILWEPGCSYLLQPFKIVNAGNLALKIDIVVSGFVGDAKLAEAIEYGLLLGDANNPSFVPSGDLNDFNSLFDAIENPEYDFNVLKPGDVFDISGDGVTFHMKEEAGNDYQGLTLTGMSITVRATQATVESDSYNNQYDKDAVYPVTTADEAAAALANANPGDVIVLNGNIGTIDIPANANGITIVAEAEADLDKITLADGAEDITIDGATMASSENLIELGGNNGTVTLKNCVLTGSSVKSGRGVSGGANTDLVIENCEFVDVGYPINDAWASINSLTITNTVFNKANSTSTSWAILCQGAVSTVTIDNCVFDTCFDGIAKLTGLQANGTFVFTNNTMVNCAAHAPYGLFQVNNTDTANITWSGNTLDGAELANPFNN